MPTLLSPAALWSLAALALPLAIHLWRRPPRTVRLGSLRFLQTRARRLQNLRWREHALLLARLGLLTLLALALARPLWHQPPSPHPPRWVLLDPAAAPAGPSLDRLHALQSTGYETRLLVPRFPAIHAPPADPATAAPDLWSLLREADAALPAGSSLAVVSPGRLASLHGLRPALAHVRVEWIDTPSAPLAPDPSPAPPPPSSPLSILILHDADRAEDARVVAAAFRAVSQADQRALAVSVALATDAPAPAADWIFWLGARPVPPALADRTANLFTDAAAPALADTAPGWIIPQPDTGFGPPIRLWQRTPPTEGPVIWTDEFGLPLLTRTHDAHGARWRFASRFAPAWNDLPLGTALPASLRTLLSTTGDALTLNRHDPRLADPSQCLPSDAPATAVSTLASPGTAIDLRPPLWLLAVILFCLERLLSHRRAPSPVTTASPAAAQPAMSR